MRLHTPKSPHVPRHPQHPLHEFRPACRPICPPSSPCYAPQAKMLDGMLEASGDAVSLVLALEVRGGATAY